MLAHSPNNGQGGSTCDDYHGKPCKGCPQDAPGMPESGGACTNSSWPFVDPETHKPVGDVERTFHNQLSPDGSGMLGRKTAIQDAVRVPTLPPGEYVVGFRCEPQARVCALLPGGVHGSCAN